MMIEENEDLDEFLEHVLTYILESTIIDRLLKTTPHRAESWKLEEVRRHWMLRHHCEFLLFPCQYPALPLPSKIGKYFWHLHCTSGKPTPHYKKLIVRCVANTLLFLQVYKPKITYLIIPDIMFDINWLDYHRRVSVMRSIEKMIRYDP
ncbi:hypothetical protein C0J52_20329 [Blattella germanica]|nr:hypothetical protein C0J52_20329 [Blattella germanica]